MRLLSVFQMVNMCELVFSVQHNYICAQICQESYPGTSTPSKTHKKPSGVLIFTGGAAEAFLISYPVLITEVTRPRRSEGCWLRRSPA